MIHVTSPTRICECCRYEPASETVPDDNPEDPYRVCTPCRKRLESRSLRPREWFHLAARYGWRQYLLHDDFYDDNGTACHPAEPVEHPASFHFPTPTEWEASFSLSMDVAFAKWQLPEAILPILAARPEETMAGIDAAVAERKNPHFESRAYEIAARAIGPQAADWIRHRWKVRDTEGPLVALAEASAACLPSPEGLERVERVLRAMAPTERRESLWALAYFRDARVLSFIEEFAAAPTMETWGRVAACSRFSWGVVEKWLQRGRPLNLVALDALGFCFNYDTLGLRTLAPELEDPPDPETLEQTLRHHAEIDNAWRVESQVAFLLKNAARITSKDASRER